MTYESYILMLFSPEAFLKDEELPTDQVLLDRLHTQYHISVSRGKLPNILKLNTHLDKVGHVILDKAGSGNDWPKASTLAELVNERKEHFVDTKASIDVDVICAVF